MGIEGHDRDSDVEGVDVHDADILGVGAAAEAPGAPEAPPTEAGFVHWMPHD
jgi:hypothetical protein